MSALEADKIRELRLNTVGRFLARARTKAGLSQRDVSDTMGYSSPQFCSNWERGLSLPPIGTLGALHKLIGFDRAELVQRWNSLNISMADLQLKAVARELKTSAAIRGKR